MRHITASPQDGDLVRVFRWVFLSRRTGILAVGHGDAKKRFHFVSGELFLHDGHPLALRLADLLSDYRRGGLNGLGGTGPYDKEGNLREVIHRIAEHLASWELDHFLFTEGLVAPLPQLLGPLPTGALLMEAAALRYDEASLTDRLGGREAMVIATAGADEPPAGLSEEAAQLLDNLRQPRALAELLNGDAEARRRHHQALNRLWAVDLVREVVNRPTRRRKSGPRIGAPVGQLRAAEAGKAKSSSRFRAGQAGERPLAIAEAEKPEGEAQPPEPRGSAPRAGAPRPLPFERPAPTVVSEPTAVSEASKDPESSESAESSEAAERSLAAEPASAAASGAVSAAPPSELEPESPTFAAAIASSPSTAVWRDHFHLAGQPFALTPDPEFLYLSDAHAEALAGLKLALLERRGLVVLTGEVGTGKTTIVYSLLETLDPRVETAYLANTLLSFDELLVAALNDLGVPYSSPQRLDLLEALNGHLLASSAAGKTVALVVDEAQNLSTRAFEELRLLLNVETTKEKLLQIVLVGQPELGERLAAPELRQIRDRIAVRCHLHPLGRAEAGAYVEHRLRAVNGALELFEPAALRLALRKAGGIPRRINVICHNALLFAFGRGERRVDRRMMAAAIRELRSDPTGRRPFASWRPATSEVGGSFWRSRLGWLALGVLMVTLVLLALRGLGASTARQDRTSPPEPSAQPQISAPGSGPEAAVGAEQQSEPRGIPENVQPPAPTVDARPSADDPSSTASSPAERSTPGPAPVKPTPAASAPPSQQAQPAVAETVPLAPEPGGTWTVGDGYSLYRMILRVYGHHDRELEARVLAANPTLGDPARLVPGMVVRFPVVDSAQADPAPEPVRGPGR